MNDYERILQVAADNEISVDENYQFKSEMKGLYIDGNIALRKGLTTREKKCVLAEEMAHYYTSSGDILDMHDMQNRKQEHRARMYAYEGLIGLSNIIKAHKHGCQSLSDTADFLDISEDFLADALQSYKAKYGLYKIIDHFVIYFEPSIGVFELI